jgi:hypothetical protein
MRYSQWIELKLHLFSENVVAASLAKTTNENLKESIMKICMDITGE